MLHNKGVRIFNISVWETLPVQASSQCSILLRRPKGAQWRGRGGDGGDGRFGCHGDVFQALDDCCGKILKYVEYIDEIWWIMAKYMWVSQWCPNVWWNSGRFLWHLQKRERQRRSWAGDPPVHNEPKLLREPMRPPEGTSPKRSWRGRCARRQRPIWNYRDKMEAITDPRGPFAVQWRETIAHLNTQHFRWVH